MVFWSLNWLIIMLKFLSRSLWLRPERSQTCFGNPKASPESQPSGSIVLPRLLEASPPPPTGVPHPVHFIVCRRSWGTVYLVIPRVSEAGTQQCCPWGEGKLTPCAVLVMGGERVGCGRGSGGGNWWRMKMGRRRLTASGTLRSTATEGTSAASVVSFCKSPLAIHSHLPPPEERYMGFPDSSVVKNPPANAGGWSSIPGSGRSPWRREMVTHSSILA